MAVLAITALVTAACGGEGDGQAGPVTVFAAASLTDAFHELAAAFEVTDAGVAVELNVGGSSSLREQILAGAPADVFASADAVDMAQLVQVGAVGDPVDVAANRLQIAVPAGNGAGVTGLADLDRDELLIGLCAEEVPCGRLARQALARAEVAPAIDTNEPDVRSLLSKVQAGELDAGVVYRSDVAAAGDTVEGIDIPAAANMSATYPIAVVAGASDPQAARAFVAFVRSEEGQAILAAHGFERP